MTPFFRSRFRGTGLIWSVPTWGWEYPLDDGEAIPPPAQYPTRRSGSEANTYSEASSIQPLEKKRSPPLSARDGSGMLRLDVQPGIAQVYVDGFYVGTVEEVNQDAGLPLPPGWHRLEFRAPGFQTPAANVTIEAGGSITFRLALFPTRLSP
jgi:PEGA domain